MQKSNASLVSSSNSVGEILKGGMSSLSGVSNAVSDGQSVCLTNQKRAFPPLLAHCSRVFKTPPTKHGPISIVCGMDKIGGSRLASNLTSNFPVSVSTSITSV